MKRMGNRMKAREDERGSREEHNQKRQRKEKKICPQLKLFPQESCCDDYIDQLIPTSAPIPKIKVKVFGHPASGKTSLVESMRAGYFTGLFRRSKRGSTNKVRHRTNTKGN